MGQGLWGASGTYPAKLNPSTPPPPRGFSTGKWSRKWVIITSLIYTMVNNLIHDTGLIPRTKMRISIRNNFWIELIPLLLIYRGYYMAARRYEISLRVLKNISRVSAANEWNIFQHEKRNFASPSDHVIFFLLYKILTIQQNMLCSLFQKLRFEIEYKSLQSVVYLYQS